jgi:murein DD-endopeptidase MepM/ murein hydrolase activator NlpD
MAQMPDTFAPSVAQDPNPTTALTAGNLDPMRNAAPQQQQQMGEAALKVGDTVNNIGERIQYQLDDAKTKAAVTQFLQRSMQVIHGDGTADNPGYLNTRGQGALDGYGDATAALAKIKAQGMDGLDNNFQKMMYNRVTTQHLTSMGAVMADHRFQQGTAYATQAADDRATMSGLMASNAWKSWNQTDADGNPTGDFNTFSQVRDQEILAGQKQKVGTDDPTTPINQYALLQARSTTAKTALAQMITAQAPAADVQGFFDDMKAKGYIDARDEVAMASAVKSYVVPKNLTDDMNQAFTDAYRKNHPQAGTGAEGPDDYQGPVKGAGFTNSPYDEDAEGVHITVPQGQPVQAPGSGTVTAAGKNDDDVPFVSIQHSDGSTSTLTGMSTFNVKAGDTVKMGQQIGTSGDAGDQKNASVLWQLADKNGNAMDPTHAGLPAVQTQSIIEEKDLTDAIQLFSDREMNPDQQREGTGEMEGIVRHNQAMVAKNAQQTFQDAQQQFYAPAIKNGGIPSVSSIDPALYHSLPAEQQYQLKEIEVEQRRRQVTEAREDQNARLVAQTTANLPNQVGAQFWLATHPLATMDDVTSLGKYLTPQQLIEAARSVTTRDPKEATIDHMQMQSALTQAGLQSLFNTEGQQAHQKLASQQRYLQIQTDVQKIFNDGQAAKKAPLTAGDRQQLLNDYLINNQVMVHQPAWYQSNSNYSNDKPVNYVNLTPQQAQNAYVNTGDGQPGVPLSHITPDQHDTIVAGLLRAGHAPTMVNIAKAWREMDGH